MRVPHLPGGQHLQINHFPLHLWRGKKSNVHLLFLLYVQQSFAEYSAHISLLLLGYFVQLERLTWCRAFSLTLREISLLIQRI